MGLGWWSGGSCRRTRCRWRQTGMRESNDPVATGTPSGDRDTTGWDTQTDRRRTADTSTPGKQQNRYGVTHATHRSDSQPSTAKTGRNSREKFTRTGHRGTQKKINHAYSTSIIVSDVSVLPRRPRLSCCTVSRLSPDDGTDALLSWPRELSAAPLGFGRCWHPV